MPRLSDLTAVTEVTSDDVFPLVDSPNTKKTRADVLKRYMLSKVVTVGPAGSGALYVCDGTADEVEINAAITDAANADGGIVLLQPGTYTIDAPINLQSNVMLKGSGRRATTINVSSTFSQTNLWSIGATGTLATGTAINLASNAAHGATTITATAGAELSAVTAGSYLMLVSDALWETLNQSLRERGEYVRVVSVASPNVTIYGMIRDDYNTADAARLYRVSFIEHCGIMDLTIRQAPALDTRAGLVPPLVSFQMCLGAFAIDCEIGESDGPALTVHHSVGTVVAHNFIHDLTDNQPQNRLGYGILIGGCSENVIVQGNRCDRMRHGIDAGPSSSNFPSGISNNGIPRGVTVVGNTVLHCSNTGISTHSEAEGWEIAGNTVEDCESCGIGMRGRACSVTGNKIAFCSGGVLVGSGVYSTSSGSGSGCSVVGNTVKHIKNVTPGSTGTNFGGYGIIIVGTDNVVVKGNSIIDCDAAGIRVRQYARRNVFVDNTILNANLLDTANISAIEIEANAIGTTATLTFAAGVVTATGLASVANPAVGKNIVISGAATAANNGSFVITAVLSATSVTYENPSGATDANNGAISWFVESCSDNLFKGNSAMNTAASEFGRNVTGHAKFFCRDAGTSGNCRNVFDGNAAVGMETEMFSFNTLTPYSSSNNSYNGITTWGNEKLLAREYIIDVKTPAGGATNLLLLPTTTGRNYAMKGYVQGSNGGAGIWLYDINALFLNNAGALSQVLASPVVETHESSSSVTTTCGTDGGTNMRVQVSSIASPVTWTGRLVVSEARF